MQTTPHDSQRSNFMKQNICTKFRWDHPQRGHQMHVGLKL